MEKAEESGSDPHLAMLIYRATPIRPGQLSPGEMLSGNIEHSFLSINICIPIQRSAGRRKYHRNKTNAMTTIGQPRNFKIYNNFRVSGSSQIPRNQSGRKPRWYGSQVKVRPGDMRYRLNPVLGTSGIVAIFVHRLRSNQKNCTRPHEFPEQNQSLQDLDLSNIPAQQQLMSLTSHHKSHCSNSVCRERPRSELRCLVHDVLLDHLRD